VPLSGGIVPRSECGYYLVDLSIYLPTYLPTTLCWALAAFSLFNLFTQSVGFLGRGISPLQGRCLHTGRQKQNKRTQISMPQVGYEPTIPLFERV
jgi:hypothetical protein